MPLIMPVKIAATANLNPNGAERWPGIIGRAGEGAGSIYEAVLEAIGKHVVSITIGVRGVSAEVLIPQDWSAAQIDVLVDRGREAVGRAVKWTADQKRAG